MNDLFPMGLTNPPIAANTDSGMTTANKITIVRILLVPVFIVMVLYYIDSGDEIYRLGAILSFAVASISDGVDGYIARHYNQHSELGKILDPLADKLLLISGVILLSLRNEHLMRIPPWLTYTILSRDLLLLIGLAVIHYTCGKVIVRPAIAGKIATVFQMTCISWALLKFPGNWLYTFSLCAAIFTGISGIIYLFDGVRQLSASPSSSPAPPRP